MRKLLQISLIVILVLSTVLFASACEYDEENGGGINSSNSSTLTSDNNDSINDGGNCSIDMPLAKEYTVQFDVNGGSEIPSEKTTSLKTAPSTYRKDYLFDGWFLDSALRNEVKFPLDIENDTTLYAKWVKLADTQHLQSSVIKCWSGNESSAIYYITPSGFELEKLATLDYSMQIEVSYNVHYEKDYNVPLDIGYAGAPKYEIYVINSDRLGVAEEDVKTELTKVSKTITYTSNVVDLINQRITLEFSTDNIQNKIHFTNIVVSYKCVEN